MLIALARGGTAWSSEELARQVDQWRQAARPVALAIGGLAGTRRRIAGSRAEALESRTAHPAARAGAGGRARAAVPGVRHFGRESVSQGRRVEGRRSKALISGSRLSTLRLSSLRLSTFDLRLSTTCPNGSRNGLVKSIWSSIPTGMTRTPIGRSASCCGAVPFARGMAGAGRRLRPGQARTRLRAAGARCFGVDLSASLLRIARGVTDAPLIRADMRYLPVRPHSMDLTVNLFTSFGYFERDEEHADALSEMVGTVRPGGWFVIDLLNPAAVRAGLVPHETMRAGNTEALHHSDDLPGQSPRLQDHPSGPAAAASSSGCGSSNPRRSPACSCARG